MTGRVAILVIALAVTAAACGDGGTTETEPPGDITGQTITLITHDSFAVSEGVLDEFTAATGVAVRLLRAGDAGAMVNQAILTKDNPLADVLFGVDNAFLSRALTEGLFLRYESPLLDQVSADLRLDDRVTPIDFGDVCLNYDKAALAAVDIEPPRNLRDLTLPQFAGKLVVESPATSSPGLAFLLATIVEFGESGDYTWKDYWADLRANDVQVAAGWEDAYYGAFTIWGGDRPIVVSYASSPPAEVIFAEDPPPEAPTAVVVNSCFRQIEFAGILSGTEKVEAAMAFIDFMLSMRFQEDIPLNMFVFPANENAALPEAFIEHTIIPTNSRTLPPTVIEANRSVWIDDWFDIVVR